MATLSDRIVDAQNDLNRLRDQLTDHVKEDNADEIVTGELADQIEQKEGVIAALKRAESALAAKSGDPENQRSRKPAAPSRSAGEEVSESKDLMLRSAVVQVLSHIEKRSINDILKARYGADESVKALLDVTTKAASAPATTTTTGWAAELVQTATLDFLESLMPLSIYPGLRDRGGRFTFGRNGVVSIPSRAATPTVAGSFVAQGGAIPVRQAAFNATTLTPKKMAVITTFTREISEHSTPAIEAVLRRPSRRTRPWRSIPF
jgi:HK97 family phage major capsid protein